MIYPIKNVIKKKKKNYYLPLIMREQLEIMYQVLVKGIHLEYGKQDKVEIWL